MTATLIGPLAAIDLRPTSVAVAVPYADFDLLRRADPVRWHPERDGRGFWAVTRYDDVLAVSKDTADVLLRDRGILAGGPGAGRHRGAQVR